MDADQIRRLRPELTRYLKRFDDCFVRSDTRAYLPVYIEGQLSNLSEKSCEPMALAAGVPPRNLQEFLSAYKWDENLARNRLRDVTATSSCSTLMPRRRCAYRGSGSFEFIFVATV